MMHLREKLLDELYSHMYELHAEMDKLQKEIEILESMTDLEFYRERMAEQD